MSSARDSDLALSASGLAPKRELFAWAMYDFANSGYTTVVLTAIYSVYFVAAIATTDSSSPGQAELLWTITISLAYFLVLLSAPILGAIADYRAGKKRYLAITTIICVAATLALGWVGPGQIVLAMTFMIIGTTAFALGEGLISAFLPEIAVPAHMGRISGYAWTLGYLGGLVVLFWCLAYVSWAQGQGQLATQYVPVTLWITAASFALAALPTFLWLRERAQPANGRDRPHRVGGRDGGRNYISIGFDRVRQTLRHARQYQDLFRFLTAMAVFYCGIYTVIVLAAVYAKQVMGFDTRETITLILIVNITAAAGAFAFGWVQDKLGSIRTLYLTMLIWIAALLLAFAVRDRGDFWLVANLVGIALGSSQSAGRALVGQLAPAGRSAEFFGLWALAGKLAAIVGPLSYGLITYLTQGNHRAAMLSTTSYFILGLLLLTRINERRGRAAAQGRMTPKS